MFRAISANRCFVNFNSRLRVQAYLSFFWLCEVINCLWLAYSHVKKCRQMVLSNRQVIAGVSLCRKAKEMINQIISRGGDPSQLNDGHVVVELMVPGPRVGLVIGKGGETIRGLQV